MWLLLACVAHHPPLGLDPGASVALVSPPGAGNPHSVTLRATTDAERIEFWVDGVRVGDTLPGEPLPWRAPATGVARVEAFAMRDGRAVARARQDTELGVGLSDAVAAIVDTYPTDGTMGFYWPPDDGVWWGTTRDVTYAGQLVSPASPDRSSHCVGLTWEVAMAALQSESGTDTFNGLDLAALAEFRTDWFVRRILGAGAAEAVVHYGLGERVPRDDARRGDFIQMWSQGGGGHSGVFDRWVVEKRRIVGVRYWSTHPALNGIGYHEDRFGDGGISKGLFYVARLWQREDWVAPPGSPSR